VIGVESTVRGFGLAGALVVPAASPAEVRDAWASLPAEVEVAILTPAAAEALEAGAVPPGPLRVVMPR
jgi:vacuolar-type H+-ATPase subunit F/Vma7